MTEFKVGDKVRLTEEFPKDWLRDVGPGTIGTVERARDGVWPYLVRFSETRQAWVTAVEIQIEHEFKHGDWVRVLDNVPEDVATFRGTVGQVIRVYPTLGLSRPVTVKFDGIGLRYLSSDELEPAPVRKLEPAFEAYQFTVGDRVRMTDAYKGTRPYLVGEPARIERVNTDPDLYNGKPYLVHFDHFNAERAWVTVDEIVAAPGVSVVKDVSPKTPRVDMAAVDKAVEAFASRGGSMNVRNAMIAAVIAYKEAEDQA